MRLLIGRDWVFHDVQVAELARIDDIYHTRECFRGIYVAHIVEGAQGRYTYANAAPLPDIQHGLDDLIEKARPVTGTAAVCVRPGIGV